MNFVQVMHTQRVGTNAGSFPGKSKVYYMKVCFLKPICFECRGTSKV